MNKEEYESPYCEVCGTCGCIGCCGIRNFISNHIEGKTNCKNESWIISDLINLCDYKDEVFEENKQLQQELNQKNKVIEEIKEDLKRRIKSYEERQNQGIELTEVMSIRLASDKYILDKIEELEKGSEE